MTIAPDSPLATLWVPSPDRGARVREPRAGHVDTRVSAYEDVCRSRARLADAEKSKVSCHYLMDEEGRIAQMVPRRAAPGTPGKACGPERPILIPARSASRSTIPATISTIRIFQKCKCVPSRRSVSTSWGGMRFRLTACLPIPILRRVGNAIPARNSIGSVWRAPASASWVEPGAVEQRYRSRTRRRGRESRRAAKGAFTTTATESS